MAVSPTPSPVGPRDADRIIDRTCLDRCACPSRLSFGLTNEPVVLLEAIAAGVAQLATAIGGMPELVQKGITGELVPPGDLPGSGQRDGRLYSGNLAEPSAAGARRLRWRVVTDFPKASVEAIEATYERVLLAPHVQRLSRWFSAGDWPMPGPSICNLLFSWSSPAPGNSACLA